MQSSTKPGTRTPERETHRRWSITAALFVLPFILLVLLGLVSCASKEVYIPASEKASLENRRMQESENDRAASASRERGREGKDRQGGITEEDISTSTDGRRGEGSPQRRAPIKDVYFDFDSYTLRSTDLAALNDLSVWLSANRRVNLTIEGHCDERGSVEYNLALGQKRAEAVREHLLTLGVEKRRIKTISYGKETPAETGHTEEAWAQNRRAHIKID